MNEQEPENSSRYISGVITTMLSGLVEREAAAKAALLACLAGENVLLIGPPGTAKSMLARRIAEASGGDYFEYLLTKFTTPDELFGPLSIAELKADRFWRKTEGYLPTATIAFLDEVFKASSSILNALLSLMNERVFHNGSERVATPLRAIIGATNELPTGQEELAALYDRFLVRIFVDEVSEDSFSKLCVAGEPPPLAPIDPSWLINLDAAARAVRVKPEIVTALATMRRLELIRK
ncbi:MAG: AAA family ATPase [Pseudomonadota bacterium]